MRTYVLTPLLGGIGAAVAVGGAVVHRHGASGLPWGLVLALATAVACVPAAVVLAGGPGGVAFAGTWTLSVLVLSQSRSEGDYLVANDWVGQVFVWGGALLVPAVLVVAMSRSGTRDSSPPSRLEG